MLYNGASMIKGAHIMTSGSVPTGANSPPRLCCEDNWKGVLDDPNPRAIRWAQRTLASRFDDPDWGKWHWTEGNGAFTACKRVIVLFAVDDSPQEDQSLTRITCGTCLSMMKRAGVSL